MISLIIPAYNESYRIGPYLAEIIRYLRGRHREHEILVVDDGSTDDTAAHVEAFRADAPALRVIRLSPNRGKGAAVRIGMRAARGDLQLMADADGATRIEELEYLEAAIQRGADLAIGSRFLASRDPAYHVAARWHRSILGNLFNGLVQRVAVPGVQDTQCGFKLFRRHVARDLFSVSRLNGYGFDIELLFVARKRGYRIAEVPVNWTDQPGSKVRVLRDGIQMLRELLLIRARHARGEYAKCDATTVGTLEQTVTP